jgi:hypothetical protein
VKENIHLEIALEPKLLENRLDSIGNDYWYKVDGEILMSKLTGRMTVKSIFRNLCTNEALATCPRKGSAQLDRFWSVT